MRTVARSTRALPLAARLALRPSLWRVSARAFAGPAAGEPVKTALYDAHVKLGGKVVDFAGFALPVKYGDSVLDSHKHCREQASVFDVSHMGQLKLFGAKALDFLETICVGDLHALNKNQGTLSVLTTPAGTIIDDCIITKKDGYVYMVVNAGCKDKDLKHMGEQLVAFNKKHQADVRIEELTDRALLALQGPKAAAVLAPLLAKGFDLSKLGFMHSEVVKVAGYDTYVTRCGYTGEDGFEISVPNKDSIPLLYKLLENPTCLPAGLGVRDSLRLEAGLCLYGHDLNDTITPIEASLNWLISKRRREAGGFLGFDKIAAQLKDPKSVLKKRVGLEVLAGAPAREGAEILDLEGKTVGVVTSGTVSPTSGKKIAMGYVERELSKVGTKLQVSVRGKKSPAEIVKMPFVETSYFRG